MISLAFNTTGIGTQFALNKDGEKYYLDIEFSKHSETFFPMLDGFLKEHNTKLEDVKNLCVVVGPGSFTGIRIGLSVAKMFSYVLKQKCIKVNALEVLAYNMIDKDIQNICAIINAGSGNLYYQLFTKKGDYLEEITAPRVCSFMQFEKIKEKLENFEYVYYDNNEKKFDFVVFQTKKQNFSAQSLQLLMEQKIKKAEFVDYKNLMPLYLRTSQAEIAVYDGEISIREANLSYLQKIVELEKNADSDDLPWNENAIKQSFSNKSFKCFLAEKDDECVGYVSFMDLGDEYEILRIIVSKKARMRGVAKIMLSNLFKKAKENDIKDVVLEVNKFNYSALLLYEKLGFCIVGKRNNYYHNNQDGLIMKKFIQE
ncbi:MAG: tRNA (adenosine(37)-N6)-threonylcarbamoyltransferase complex dimerization subunit type 1 TsaB [Clostridia bacterium]|nr:tRNA (adenosine(37)-N6)-threonylcarbamoyltransferase complex dimerization subunit type 1 TsaB [Clostridia bacterium]